MRSAWESREGELTTEGLAERPSRDLVRECIEEHGEAVPAEVSARLIDPEYRLFRMNEFALAHEVSFAKKAAALFRLPLSQRG